MYFTTRSSAAGREIVDMISGQVVAVYTTGNLESRQQADAAANAARAELLTNLAGAGLIVANRTYPLPTLQQAYAAYSA